MSPPDVIAHVSNREVDGVVFVLTGRNRSCRFIGPKYDRDEHRSVCISINRNEVLNDRVSKASTLSRENTYALLPSPVPGHKVTVPSFSILELAVGNVVDTVSKIRVSENVMDDLPRITEPELIVGSHPLGYGRIFWAETVILNGIRLPGYVAKFNGINCCVKVFVVKYWRRVVVRNQCGTPDAEESVDNVV